MGIQNFCVLMLQLFLFFHSKTIDSAKVSDTMVAGKALTGSQTIISNNGIFQLGFFNLQNSSKWYVGIWYAEAIEQTIAWVANSETPLQNASAIFYLTENGSLVISYRGSVIWSTQGNTKASSAKLTDWGNLVVTSTQDKSQFIWQSSDIPGSVWLPGMKISATTKLISWKSPWDPSPGLFSLQLDPSGMDQLVLRWNNSVTYWESGLWNGEVFSNIPAMKQNRIHNYSFVNNGTHKYFTYVPNPNALARYNRMVDMWGKLRVSMLQGNPAKWTMFWSAPGKSCDVYGVCGAYGSCNQDNVQSCNCVKGFRPRDNRAWEIQGWSGGCVRQTPSDCQGGSRNHITDGFVELSGKSMPSGAVPYMSQPISIQQCDETCVSKCSCTSYAYATNGTYPICQLWFGDLYNLKDDTLSSMSVFVRVAAVDMPKSSSATKKKRFLVVRRVHTLIAVSAAIIAMALLVFIWYRCRRRPVNLTDSDFLGSLKVFSYKELQIATKKFSERLGRGGFGSVFKGALPDKTLVAVKKLENLSHSHGDKQFRMEVSNIGTIHHVNLVRLLGFCSDESHRLLVYDFMPNGSLNTLLFPKRQGLKILDWKTRFGIILGTARGLLYLHEECRDCIIHCDVKPDNILLDSDLCPKLADFGMAKLMGRDFSCVLTTMRGTRGYLAPEWISGLPITAKADVYSFGMTVLEIVSGRRNANVDPEDSEFFFPAWAAAEINKGNAMGVVENNLKGEVDSEEAKRVVMVAAWCIQDQEEARPSMRQVVQILQGLGEAPGVPPIPKSLGTLL